MSRKAHRQERMHRRRFLRTAAALTAAPILAAKTAPAVTPGEDSKLAVDGGTPVRSTPLHAGLCGPQFYGEEEKRELLDVLESRSPFRWWGSGSSPPQKVRAFEEEYAGYLGVKYAVGVTSGTTALITAMAALEVGPGDEVILPAWTWYACYDAVVLAGGTPVFAEIDESFDIDPDDVEKKITPRTKVLMTVHLQGCPCDMDRLLPIARKHGLKVLEDCAQSVGGRYKGKFLGAIGDMGIYSFQVNKTITAGEGGAVVSSDPRLFERAMRFHDVGVLRAPYTAMLGGGVLGRFVSSNFRMSEFTGAVLRAQARKLETICGKLRKNARTVREGLSDLPGLKLRKCPDPLGDVGVGVFLDLGTAERRARFLAAMSAEGVPASPPGGSAILPVDPYIVQKSTIHPAWPSFQTPEGKAVRYGAETCPRTLDILGRHAGVIIDPNFTDEEIKDIVKAIRKVFPALA
jgi:8-amino-3,8-dideoxy-alpha-D-manno-octulosonate transaminase